MDQAKPFVDPVSGFNSVTNTFHSLRPPIDLPPEDTPISAAAYAFSLRLNSTSPDSVALINSATGQRISFSEFTRKTENLASYLRSVIGLSKGDVALILSPNLVQVPILYFSLLSLGVVISPANPISIESEISRMVQLCNPVIAFATSSTAHKLPALLFKTILLDSPEFESMTINPVQKLDRVEVIDQSDLAAIMYSSGTTGKVKGVALTHRNLMAVVAGSCANRTGRESGPDVLLYTVPYFHVYGFAYSLKSVALSEAQVVTERFDMQKMLRAVEEFKVSHVVLTPPVVVTMAKSDVTDGYDLRSLEGVSCGAAPLGKDVITAFAARFPRAVFVQGYGLTETTGPLFITVGHRESLRWGSAGKLFGDFEAKMVDPETGDGLPPGKQGELWVKGPSIMKGYVGDPEATSATIVADGWLRTGDLCYIDKEGFLFVTDRLKELIKYKGYQVAPVELEQLLQSHPEIVDVAVIPYPDEEAGEVPMACVVRQPQSSLSGAKIMDFVAKKVAPYKKIRRVAFVNSIPKSASGKILRKELIKLFCPSYSSKL